MSERTYGVCISPYPVLFLASKSPRRRALLEAGGLHYEVVNSNIDDGELSIGGASVEEWVMGLAYLKARAALRSLALPDPEDRRVLILGADTVVLKGTDVIGQPRDADDARRIIRTLSGGEHRVLSGIALLNPHANGPSRRDLAVDSATVRVGEIPDASIDGYVDSGDWAGKAGAYNLQERIDAGWPIAYDGDPTTIMGLPMRLLVRRLTRFGNAATAGPHS